jgi:NAD(P)-dependent dehydrogenase (short-subunit alcohol dehydrogenase family)
MNSQPNRLLVTGGAGFIGANFVHHWRRAHPADLIVVLDALTYAGNRANLHGLEAGAEFIFVHGDIRSEGLVEDLLERHALDTLVHFAAESHVDRSIAGPDAFIDARAAESLPPGLAREECAAVASLPPHLNRRGLRLARARRPCVLGNDPVCPKFPVRSE